MNEAAATGQVSDTLTRTGRIPAQRAPGCQVSRVHLLLRVGTACRAGVLRVQVEPGLAVPGTSRHLAARPFCTAVATASATCAPIAPVTAIRACFTASATSSLNAAATASATMPCSIVRSFR